MAFSIATIEGAGSGSAGQIGPSDNRLEGNKLTQHSSRNEYTPTRIQETKAALELFDPLGNEFALVIGDRVVTESSPRRQHI